MIQENFIKVGPYKTRALVVGKNTNPLHLLIHGWGDSADTYRPLLKRLDNSSQHAIAIDLPGFGKADPLKSGPVLGQYDSFIANILKSRINNKTILVGNSLGGCVAIRASIKNPKLVKATLALAPAGLGLTGWLSMVERDPVARRLLNWPFPLPQFAVEAVMAEIYGRIGFVDSSKIDLEIVQNFTSHLNNRKKLLNTLSIGHKLTRELENSINATKITTPTLLLWGDHDRLVHRKGASLLLPKCETSALITLRDCGHLPQIEALDDVEYHLTQLRRAPKSWVSKIRENSSSQGAILRAQKSHESI